MRKAQYLHPSIMNKQLWQQSTCTIFHYSMNVFSCLFLLTMPDTLAGKNVQHLRVFYQQICLLCPYCCQRSHVQIWLWTVSCDLVAFTTSPTHAKLKENHLFASIRWQGVRGWMTAMCFQVMKIIIGLYLSGIAIPSTKNVSQAFWYTFQDCRCTGPEFNILYNAYIIVFFCCVWPGVELYFCPNVERLEGWIWCIQHNI